LISPNKSLLTAFNGSRKFVQHRAKVVFDHLHDRESDLFVQPSSLDRPPRQVRRFLQDAEPEGAQQIASLSVAAPHIFAVHFFTTKGGSGTGLGLVISHRIVVERHNGKIDFSTGPDGTQFNVRLPFESRAHA
jgi:hypothetical protein